MSSNEVILWLDSSPPEHIAANRVMLCLINEFALNSMRRPYPEEFHDIIAASGSAGIVKL